MPLLELTDVHARYGQVAAVHGISLTVDDGEIVSLLGANGAGKTTTLRAISGHGRDRRHARLRRQAAAAQGRRRRRGAASRTFPRAAASSAS